MSREKLKAKARLGRIGVFVVGAFIAAFCYSSTVAMGEKVTLKAVWLGASWGVAAKELAKEYEAKTGVKVEIELVGRDAIYEKLALEFASRASRYDLFNIDYNWIPQFAEAGHLQPIDQWISEKTEFEDFLDRAVEITGRWKGSTYGLPQTVHPHLLWYRKDLFGDAKYRAEFKEKYGYDLAPPETMSQWRDIVEFFNGRDTNQDGKPDLYGWAAQASKGYGNVHTWLTFVYSFGTDVFDWDTMEPTLTRPEVVAATKFWVDIINYCPPGIHEYTFAEVAKDAAAGRLATALHWSWSSWEVDDPDISDTLGLWEFVQVPKKQVSIPHFAGWSTVISTYSKQPYEAFRFLEWLESKENDIRQTLMGGGDPVRKSSYDDPRLTEAKIPGTDVLRFRRFPELKKAMQVTKPRPQITPEEQWEVIVSQYLHAAQLGQMSVEKALEIANARVRMMMERSGYYK